MNFDLNSYPLSERNGTYGGKAGSKEGIIIDGENWIVKYPQNTQGMRGTLASYTTAPLSEYIGSNVYAILGIDVHKTALGTRNGKLIVACKDFCKTEGSLREIRTLKNIYNKELNEQLEASISSTSDSHLINLEDIMIHLNYNPVLQRIPDIKTRFWEQVIVDALINNNDRNNGNWGVLYEDGEYKLAPVFDNGAAFYNKLPDSKLSEYLADETKFKQSADMSRTVFALKGKPLMAKDLTLIENESFYKTAARLAPLIQSRLSNITEFINQIPEKYEDIMICSNSRKLFYINSIDYRLKNFILPVYDKAVELGCVSSGE
ncbi:MAG: HipA domain-containing protein [Ruminococcus sp.]|nr:HipA domain-containing protein [Ruminococcus sp.]